MLVSLPLVRVLSSVMSSCNMLYFLAQRREETSSDFYPITLILT